MSLGGGIVTWGRKSVSSDGPARVLRAAPGRLARLRHAAPPAVHGLAPLATSRSARRSRPCFHLDRMLWTLAAFALAMGVAAHALDELNGRPLAHRDPDRGRSSRSPSSRSPARSRSASTARSSGAGACSRSSPSARSSCRRTTSSSFGGRFHTDWWFAIAWGGFAALTGFFVEAQSIRLEGLLAAAYATALSLAQRRLSTPVRHARRTLGDTAGTEPLEHALHALTWASLLVACALVAARLT